MVESRLETAVGGGGIEASAPASVEYMELVDEL
jgi:hypothetical protein